MDCEDARDGWGMAGANMARNIIGAEDEDFENDLVQTVDDHFSHFNSMDLLKTKPTHLLVFLHHIMLQFDCAPVLCYLHADLIKNLSAKETKKNFVEFYNNFMDKGAILRVTLPSQIATELDRTRPELISEDLQKRYVQEIQSMHFPEIQRQLLDFRQKRMMGMTPNEHELNEVENHYPTDRVPREMKEKAVAEMLLEKLSETNPSIVADDDKCSAIFSAVTYYMKHLGVKSRAPDSKKSRGFFRWKPPKKEEPKHTKVRSIITGTTGWLTNSSDRDKTNHERKGSGIGSSSRGSGGGEGVAVPFLTRKVVPPGPSTVQVPETNEPAHGSTATSTPDPTHTDTGLLSSRTDSQSGPEGGEVSPACPTLGVTVWENPLPSDVTPEESHDSPDAPQQPTDSPTGPAFSPLPQQEEVEPRLLELEQDPPNWRELASSEVLNKLSKKETKRQEVINELFATEHAHVRMLSVLQTVFSRPLEREQIMNTNEVSTIFPNLDEIIDMHYVFYENLKKLRQDDGYVVKKISTPLLNRFNGSEGEWFQKLTARFCSHQSWALDQIKSRQRKDPRFNAFILEAESRPQCRRLQLKDIIPIEMQRLTKYPLLLENIAKSTEDNAERENIQQAAECCRKILESD